MRYLPEAQGSLARGAGGRDVHRTHTCAPYAYQPRGSGVPYAPPTVATQVATGMSEGAPPAPATSHDDDDVDGGDDDDEDDDVPPDPGGSW